MGDRDGNGTGSGWQICLLRAVWQAGTLTGDGRGTDYGNLWNARNTTPHHHFLQHGAGKLDD